MHVQTAYEAHGTSKDGCYIPVSSFCTKVLLTLTGRRSLIVDFKYRLCAQQAFKTNTRMSDSDSSGTDDDFEDQDVIVIKAFASQKSKGKSAQRPAGASHVSILCFHRRLRALSRLQFWCSPTLQN